MIKVAYFYTSIWYIFRVALTLEEDFHSLIDENYDDAIDIAKKMIIEKSIAEDSGLWDLDEVYYLNYENVFGKYKSEQCGT